MGIPMSEWQTIETMPPKRYAIVGRWCCGGPSKGFWHQALANWGQYSVELGGMKFWSYENTAEKRPSPFYDDDGNYAEPTHWFAIPWPPQ